MAKKSSKPTRRTRAKKVQVSKKATASKNHKQQKPSSTLTEEAIIVKPKEATIEIDINKDVVDERPEPQNISGATLSLRKRAIVCGSVLAVVAVVLIVTAVLIHSANNSPPQTASSNGISASADQILQTGGNVCTNASGQTDSSESTNPDSVGMILQSVPVNTIQTPQSMTGADDASVLQGAACY